MAKARYAAFRLETTTGTYNGAATPVYPRLIGDDAMDLRPIPQFADVRTADSNNRLIEVVSSRFVTQNRLSTFLYPNQAAWMLGWTTDVNGTTGELPSYSVDYFDGLTFFQTLGVFVKQLTLESAPESDEGIVKATLDLWALKPGTPLNSGTFPLPNASLFPSQPYKFVHSKTGLTLVDTGTSTRVKYNKLKLTITNNLSYNFDEDQYPSDITYHGRDIKLETSIRYTSAAELGWFEAKTPIKAKIVLAAGTTPNLYTTTIDLLTKNTLRELGRTQPLAKPSYQDITLTSVIDPTTGTGNDLSYTVVQS